ncbi:MAG: DUF2063 domain-containing protein [Bacteriovoracia bacterium]
MKLANLQRWLRWIITEPRGVTEALDRPDKREPKPRLLAEVADAPPLCRVRRLDIYAEAYFARLVECLAKDFEAVSSVLDEDSFRRVVADYLEVYPSKTLNIGEVGRSFSDFLKGYAFASGVPYLSDLAKLEWALIEAFYAENTSRFDPSTLAALSPEAWSTLTLTLHPSVHILRLNWPVDTIWKARRETDVPTDLLPEDTALLVYRQGFILNVERIDPLQREFLQLILDRLPLGTALDKIQEKSESSETELGSLFQTWFAHWVGTGIIQCVEVMT